MWEAWYPVCWGGECRWVAHCWPNKLDKAIDVLLLRCPVDLHEAFAACHSLKHAAEPDRSSRVAVHMSQAGGCNEQLQVQCSDLEHGVEAGVKVVCSALF